jgi:TolB protein
MKQMKMVFLVILTMLIYVNFHGQGLSIADAKNLTSSAGDDLFPSWSPDGTKLIFQTNSNKNWDLAVYDLHHDTSYLLTRSPFDEQHPIWIKNGKAIAFDSNESGEEKIYVIEEGSNTKSLLFIRRLMTREPSMSASERLVYFSGYDETKNRWEIYSYEFVFNNLNKLTSSGGLKNSPEVSAKDDYILFAHTHADFPQERVSLINWYGNVEKTFDEFNMFDPAWTPGGLKFIFISDKDDQSGELYSVWLDGSHLERMTFDTLEIKTPSVSPDGKYLAISVRLPGGFDLFLVPMEDY